MQNNKQVLKQEEIEALEASINELKKTYSNNVIGRLFGIDGWAIEKKLKGILKWTKRDFNRIFFEPVPDFRYFEFRDKPIEKLLDEEKGLKKKRGNPTRARHLTFNELEYGMCEKYSINLEAK